MNKKDKKIKIGILIFWFVLIASFVFLAFFVHLKANGWRVNWRTWQLIKTGMIALDGTPDSAEVKINGKIYSRTLPIKIRDLAPGYYDITVSASGYQEWQQLVYVEPGKAGLYQNIVLFLKNPQEASVPTNMTAENLEESFQNQTKNLKISGSEIYYQDKFITRFSQNVLAAIIYSDNNHFIFQQNDEIRAIDFDGSNNQFLFKLSVPVATSFTIKNSGKTLYYLDQGNILAKNIN